MARAVLWMMLLALGTSAAVGGQTGGDAAALTRLLHEFLAGASRADVAVHERFWDDDLVYTSSAGERFGKADILAGLRGADPADAEASAITYRAEAVRVRIYGDVAVVAFRLLGESAMESMAFFNTGTFVRRGDEWRAVAWQATRIPGAASPPRPKP